MGVEVRANGTIWAAVLVCVTCACSKDAPPDTKGLEIAGGPRAPELAFRSDPEPAESAPIALTASDGTGLLLTAIEARTVIEDPLAFTELHLTFHNPENRRREGRFEIALPPEAAISRFAMRVASGWQEGEVVERKRAQQVYEDFLHRKQDPALLEKNAGNQFAARVFPIEANADKEIIIAYSEELREQREPYRLRLKGLPRLGSFKVDVRLGSRTGQGDESRASGREHEGQLTLQKTDYVPEGDLEVRLPWRKSFALRSGELVVARVTPVTKLAAAELDGLSILFDTSASRALGFGAQIEHLDALLKALYKKTGKDFDLRVLAFDQSSEEIYRGPVSRFGVRDQGKLLARDALGASDLGQALAALAAAPSGHSRLLVIGDGVITAGVAGTTELREAVARLAAHGVRRLDVLGEGGIQDRETLSALTRAGLATTGVVLDPRLSPEKLAEKLTLSTRDRIEVRIAGASFVYPKVLEGVQPGDEHLVFAVLPVGTPVQIELADAGATALPTLPAPAPLLARAMARARIETLSHELRALRPDADAARANLEQQIVAMSVEQRVVSDLTALLVLETESDYQRFGIAQNALTNILQVGDQGIEILNRSQHVPLEVAKRDEGFEIPSPAPPTAFDDSPARRPAEEGRLEGSDTGDRKGSAGDGFGSSDTGIAGGGSDALSRARPGKSAEQPRSMASAPSASTPAAKPMAAPVMAAAPQRDVSQQGETEKALGSTLRSRGAVDTMAGAAGLGRASNSRTSQDERSPADTGLLAAAPSSTFVRVDAQLKSVFGIEPARAAAAARVLGARARSCFAPNTQVDGQNMTWVLDVSDKGEVRTAVVAASTLRNSTARECIANATRGLRFPKPEGGNARVEITLSFSEEMRMEPSQPSQPSQPSIAASPARPRPRPRPRAVVPPTIADAYEGDLAFVLEALQRNDVSTALARAAGAHQRDPGDVMALIALGETLEAQKDLARAARVYGSLIDLFPSRPDLRRMAGARLERLQQAGLALAIDSYRKAVAQRPDHPSGHRLLAYALLQAGERQAAFRAIETALAQSYPSDRFEGVDQILREDLALIGSVWLRAEPAMETQIKTALTARAITLDQKPSLRFVLNWETDANDVDFHIYDGRGGHAFYMQPKLASGGRLYADVTTGFGPECFAIPGSARAYPYTMQAHYFSRGPMGYGMGKLQVIEHDGKGMVRFADHPFVIMKDKAFVQLAELKGPLT